MLNFHLTVQDHTKYFFFQQFEYHHELATQTIMGLAKLILQVFKFLTQPAIYHHNLHYNIFPIQLMHQFLHLLIKHLLQKSGFFHWLLNLYFQA